MPGKKSDVAVTEGESVTVMGPPEPFCSRPLSPFVQGEERSEGSFCPENVTGESGGGGGIRTLDTPGMSRML